MRTQSASRYPGILHLEETRLDLHRSLCALFRLFRADKFIFELRSSDWGNGRCSLLRQGDAYRMFALLGFRRLELTARRVVGCEGVGLLRWLKRCLGWCLLVLSPPLVDCAHKLRVSKSRTATSRSEGSLVRTNALIIGFLQFCLRRFLQNRDLPRLRVCNIA